MQLTVIGKHIEVTKALEDYAELKLGRLDKYFNNEPTAKACMSIEKESQIVEVNISVDDLKLRAEVKDSDMYAAIDKVSDVLEGQIRKYKGKINERYRNSIKSKSFANSDYEEEEFKVVASRKFAPKPMDVEEAVLQMNLLGYEFMVFLNSQTKKVNVIYKKKNGSYGLIEPEY